MAFDPHIVIALVTDFCRSRGVDADSRIRVVDNLYAAFDVVVLKGPDNRWKTIAIRHCDDFAQSIQKYVRVPAERVAFDHAVRCYDTQNRSRLTKPERPWFLSPVVVSANHWARLSQTIRAACEHGLGWMIPANHDVLIVPKPALRCLEGRPTLLHDDTGRMAAEWPDGTGYYFLRGTPFDAGLYSHIINGALSVHQIAALPDADQRSIALSYLTFEQLVAKSNAELLNVGVKGTRLYRLPLPARIVRDRVRGYGGYDYFIHMRDASHPEREFLEWVDPRIGAQRNAELCQAHAFGITLAQWLSIEQEG